MTQERRSGHLLVPLIRGGLRRGRGAITGGRLRGQRCRVGSLHRYYRATAGRCGGLRRRGQADFGRFGRGVLAVVGGRSESGEKGGRAARSSDSHNTDR